jgi:uncharacterized protein
MLTPFRFGLGAVMGSGEQVMSWVSLPDTLAAILHVLKTPELAGPVNVVSPGAVTNREFSKALAERLGRPCWFRLPAPMLKLAFGRMAEETILASQRAAPGKLLASGFTFAHPTIESALRALLPR